VVRVFHEKEAQKSTELAELGEGSRGLASPAGSVAMGPPEASQPPKANSQLLEELELARRSAERIRKALQ
jgi:hypothetical protein